MKKGYIIISCILAKVFGVEGWDKDQKNTVQSHEVVQAVQAVEQDKEHKDKNIVQHHAAWVMSEEDHNKNWKGKHNEEEDEDEDDDDDSDSDMDD